MAFSLVQQKIMVVTRITINHGYYWCNNISTHEWYFIRFAIIIISIISRYFYTVQALGCGSRWSGKKEQGHGLFYETIVSYDYQLFTMIFLAVLRKGSVFGLIGKYVQWQTKIGTFRDQNLLRSILLLGNNSSWEILGRESEICLNFSTGKGLFLLDPNKKKGKKSLLLIDVTYHCVEDSITDQLIYNSEVLVYALKKIKFDILCIEFF